MHAQLDGRSDLTDVETTDELAAGALAQVPMAWRWAWDYSDRPDRVTMAAFRRYAAPSIVLTSVAGIAESCTNDRSRRLRELLDGAIADCAAMRAAELGAPDVAAPVAIPA